MITPKVARNARDELTIEGGGGGTGNRILRVRGTCAVCMYAEDPSREGEGGNRLMLRSPKLRDDMTAHDIVWA